MAQVWIEVLSLVITEKESELAQWSQNRLVMVSDRG